ncbi:family 43 glycosylhydrolase [Marinoscillum sp. MHG1-6]|uniref:family 43 glycosylhydrolase n=1 Tax=Marinoscillum sp. MHG1-6 TaxID=2959627 RepID=UPI0021581F86|nr:family 43 glycosylhydrolase [Marinoscillum sp. MHG1-6]
MIRRVVISQLMIMVVLTSLLLSGCASTSSKNEYVGYLFAYFTGNGPGEEQVRYALSTDGFNYFALNSNDPVIDSRIISARGGVRDPHILRGEDGMFYMVLTDLYVPEMGWENTAMIMLKSKDLINWTHSIIDIPKTYSENFGDVRRVWAPQTNYDTSTGKYMLYWSMLQPGTPDIIYYAYANSDFTGLEGEPKQLLYKDGACIDGDIVLKDGKYHLFFKNEDEGAKGIMLATSDKINEGYEVQEGYVDQTDDAVEGSGTFKLINSDKYILMYDVYTSGKYQFCETDDLKNFKVIDENISMNFHPRHGSIIPITQEEMNRLLSKWGKVIGLVEGTSNDQVKSQNIEIRESLITLPVMPGTDVSSFDPQLNLFSEVKVSPIGPQDFSKGAVKYSFQFGEQTRTVDVVVREQANPVLNGYYADPEIIYSEREQKYYLYPTSDGFNWWSGKHFEVFESADMVKWTNKGKILDLTTDVEWADRNAWAPCAIEKKVGDSYKYYYYFSAAQKIGVAVADNPWGPFVDTGKPLIDFRPEGVKGGQEIDPDVFYDKQTGKYYLYWGNGYMAGVELNDDMVSINKSTLKVMTPDQTFREGTEVFFRNGKYYFLWSEDDTRSPNYKVRYATADSPLGTLNIPQWNVVIEKDPLKAIYGTGHNSVVYSKAKDQWYIVYHRFNRPKGIKMGDAAGYNREVCIDELNFDDNGYIKRTQPTVKGTINSLPAISKAEEVASVN